MAFRYMMHVAYLRMLVLHLVCRDSYQDEQKATSNQKYIIRTIVNLSNTDVQLRLN